MFNFNYLIEKINKANFIFEPFKHIYIENFLSQEHFDKIINNESFVIKIRTDQKYPDYLGLIEYIKNKKISNTTICVKAFRPSIPFFWETEY